MKRYRLKVVNGTHRIKATTAPGNPQDITVSGGNIVRGQTFLSEVDLSKKYPEKFELLGVEDGEALTPAAQLASVDGKSAVTEDEDDKEPNAEAGSNEMTKEAMFKMDMESLHKLAEEGGLEIPEGIKKKALVEAIYNHIHNG